MTALNEYKLEKKLMEERIRKVRSVLPCVSNNDIILALHNHDLDVDRTIQAFTEDISTAKGGWENTVKPKKSKSKRQQQQSEQPSAPVATASAKTNGYTNGTSVASSSSSATKPKVVPVSAATTKATVETLNRLDGADKTKAIANEVSKHTTDLTGIQKQFNAEVAAAEASLAQCFKEIRAATTNRERQLTAALSAVRADGAQFLQQRQAVLRGVASEANASKAAAELKSFLATKARDVELAHTTRFLYDNAQLIRAIDSFGHVVSVSDAPVSSSNSTSVPVTPSHSAIKHATSHSSIVSSVGEDSGLGQISPVANEKPVASVENGGIVMQSDGLSAAQLADIQRQVAERLKASGIDTTCLDNTSAPRRRAPPSERKPKTNANGNKKVNGNNAQPIELSILQ